MKQWTGLEWAAIHDLLSKRNDDEVMLCRFGHSIVTGLYSTAGFIELDHKTPEQTASLILERLALNKGERKDHYTAGTAGGSERPRTSIPNNLPRLQYFFGREKELQRIADALAPEALPCPTFSRGTSGPSCSWNLFRRPDPWGADLDVLTQPPTR